MDAIKTIESLIKGFNELIDRDNSKLDGLVKRSKMIVGKIFGPESRYLDEIDNVRFYPLYTDPTPQDFLETWSNGRNEMLNLLKVIKEDVEIGDNILQHGRKSSSDDTKASKKVFIAHGRNEEMKQAVARIIEKIGLNPIILHEQPNKGRTIIEKITDYSDVGFAIVLLSPDDRAYSKKVKPEEAKPRARQNVIFELGFFIGILGRSRVVAIYEEVDDFQIPSDYKGVLYTSYDKEGKWQLNLVKELRACGYDVDANKIL